MRPPVRPPQLRCVFFSSMYLPHLLVLPATFWTSVPFATLSVFPSLICGSCPSGQRFAYSFFQIPSHGGHPCCSAMCFVVAYAHLGLSPIRKRPCWANKRDTKTIHFDVSSFPQHNSCSYSVTLKSCFQFLMPEQKLLVILGLHKSAFPLILPPYIVFVNFIALYIVLFSCLFQYQLFQAFADIKSVLFHFFENGSNLRNNPLSLGFQKDSDCSGNF